MPGTDELARWRSALANLVRGPAPRGESFDLCRRIVAAGAPPEVRSEALRTLLEGAMADASTDVAVAQDVMRLLKARDRGEIELRALLTDS